MIVAEKFLWGREGDEAPGFEEGDARAEEQSFANVVRDEDDGFVEAASEGAEFPLKFSASDRIQGAEGLVHKQNRRVCGEGPGYADALALAAGKFAGAAVGEFRRIKTHDGKQLADARGNAATVPLLERGDESHVFRDGEMGEEAGFLNNVADTAAETDRIAIGGGAALDNDLTFGGKQQAIDKFEKGGFAAAAATEENESFSK